MSDLSHFEQLARQVGASNVVAVAESLSQIADLGLHDDLLTGFTAQLQSLLEGQPEVDRIVFNLHRFLEGSRSPLSWLALFEREPDSLATLVQVFSISQYLANTLISDTEAFDLLRITGGQPVDAAVLNDEIMTAIASVDELRSVMRILRDYRHRETMRIAYGDFVVGQPLEVVTEQISILADAIIAAALWAARRDLDRRRPAPLNADGAPVAFAVIALGKLGGLELNYSSDIDLVFVYEDPPTQRGARGTQSLHGQSANSIDEYFQRLGQTLIKILSESTSRGIAYRVDMRLRPFGEQGPLVVSLQEALDYYESQGRTWERQVFIKARPIAGDRDLGASLLDQLQAWVYRRYLMRADITGIAALKRRIEQRSKRAGDDDRNVKWGHGGIRDIEYCVQFLQLLNGGEQPAVRAAGTLEALRRLEESLCLTGEEAAALEQGYRLLRRVEHLLQIMYDRQTHVLPSEPAEFRRIALSMGYRDQDSATAEIEFRRDLNEQTSRNRKILDHLLHGAFDEDFEASPESDLVLDPEPPQDVIRSVLEPFGFSDAQAAYRHLRQLSVENIPFLSTRRSRHFLSAIAPQLLRAIARTPSPDATLINLANVSDSLGGKAVLWELFSASPASMDLCVRLCGCSPYLVSILTSNPGMIDELLDSLMLDSMPSHEALAAELDELCANAMDIAPILHSFKNSMHLRVGVRDILGKDTIQQTHQALSNIAEVCMEQTIRHEYHRLVQQLGVPMRSEGAEHTSSQPAELVVLAVGKLGGEEPNYHSDIDVIFLFDSEGLTQSLIPNRRFDPTTNRHFFNQLSQRVIQAVTRIGNSGKLFDLDVRLRPQGKSGELAITIDDLQRYFEAGGGQVWERQALCKARPIWGSPAAQAAAMACVRQIISQGWKPEDARLIREHRLQLQADASPQNIKRGEGGTMDVEFIVQMLQLAHGSRHPAGPVLVPGTLAALELLKQSKVMDEAAADELAQHYQLLRRTESGIRLLNMTTRHELPSSPLELNRLASIVFGEGAGRPTGDQLAEQCRAARAEVRRMFEEIFATYSPPQPDEP